MTLDPKEFFRKLYRRLSDTDRYVCRCTSCGAQRIMVRHDVDFRTEPCPTCGAEALSELSAPEVADLIAREIGSDTPFNLPSSSSLLSTELRAISLGDDPELRDWFRIQLQLLESLEGFADEETAGLINNYLKGTNTKILEYLLDDYYTRDFLKKVKKIVRRTIRLDSAVLTKFPDDEVNLHLREATRCWILGLWDSSVALSRATLELALRLLLQQKYKYFPSGPNCLEQLVDQAGVRSLLDRTDVAAAHDVRSKGNAIVHGRGQANADVAEELLFKVRGILKNLYSAL